jgi:hypothetical protein
MILYNRFDIDMWRERRTKEKQRLEGRGGQSAVFIGIAKRCGRIRKRMMTDSGL